MAIVSIRKPGVGNAPIGEEKLRSGEHWPQAAARLWNRHFGVREYVALCERIGEGYFKVQFGARVNGDTAVSLSASYLVSVE